LEALTIDDLYPLLSSHDLSNFKTSIPFYGCSDVDHPEEDDGIFDCSEGQPIAVNEVIVRLYSRKFIFE